MSIVSDFVTRVKTGKPPAPGSPPPDAPRASGDGAPPPGWTPRPTEDPAVLEGRYEFTRTFSDLARGKRNWQIVAFSSLALLALAVVGVVGMSLQSRTVPYVVEVDRMGRAVAIAPADAVASVSDRVVTATLAGFVSDIRTVYTDPTAQVDAVYRAYAHVAGDARGFLEGYFAEPQNDPRLLGAEGRRAVEIVSVVPVPTGGNDVQARPYRVRWNEAVTTAQDGTVERAWEGYFSVEVQPPTTTEGIERNPLGVFVTDLSWTPLAGRLVDDSASPWAALRSGYPSRGGPAGDRPRPRRRPHPRLTPLAMPPLPARRRLALLALLALAPLPSLAQAASDGPVTVALIDQADPAPTGETDVAQFTPGSVVVTASQMEAALGALLEEYRETGRARALRQSTMMVFPYGHSQPVLATAPLRTSVIELEAGETVIAISAGDTERFAYELSYTGADAATPIVLVKPLDYDVTTNLVVSTDRRIYHVTLDAAPSSEVLTADQNPQARYARHVRFYYPDEALDRLAAGLELGAALSPPAASTALASLSDLHFGYRVEGDRAVAEAVERVFDDGLHTYIELTAEAKRSGPAPVLYVLGPDGRRELLNYVLRDGRYITDRTFDRAELVLGADVRKGFLGLGGKRQVERAATLVRTR